MLPCRGVAQAEDRDRLCRIQLCSLGLGSPEGLGNIRLIGMNAAFAWSVRSQPMVSRGSAKIAFTALRYRRRITQRWQAPRSRRIGSEGAVSPGVRLVEHDSTGHSPVAQNGHHNKCVERKACRNQPPAVYCKSRTCHAKQQIHAGAVVKRGSNLFQPSTRERSRA